jgi:hypothetical protein
MNRTLDKLWFGLLSRAHYWIQRRFAAHCQREMLREVRARRRHEAVRRLELNLASQKRHLN